MLKRQDTLPPSWRSRAIRKIQQRHRLFTTKIAAVIPAILATIGAASVKNIDARQGRLLPQRTEFDLDAHIEDMGHECFKSLYRLTVEQFKTLCSLFEVSIQRKKTRSGCPAATKSVATMLCITMRMLAGANYLDVGWPYGVARSTTYVLFDEMLHALNDVLPQIQFPLSEDECSFPAEQFRVMRRSPLHGIIAALDEIAVHIYQPKLDVTPDPRKYYNRKGFFALCVQAAVAADYKFVFVLARRAGGTHYSTAFQATELYKAIQEGSLPDWVSIAADDAYVNGKYVLTPYSGFGLSQAQDAFNFYLSACRITLEQAFGMLVSRFGIFWSPLRFDIAKDTLIILVACKLHNFIIDSGDTTYYNNLDVVAENNVTSVPFVHLQNGLHTEQNTQRRRQRGREGTAWRDYVAQRLNTLGFLRPRSRR